MSREPAAAAAAGRGAYAAATPLRLLLRPRLRVFSLPLSFSLSILIQEGFTRGPDRFKLTHSARAPFGRNSISGTAGRAHPIGVSPPFVCLSSLNLPHTAYSDWVLGLQYLFLLTVDG